MQRRRTINRPAGRTAGRLTGAFALLLALCLVAGGVVPAYADEPPTMPHQFYGTVSSDGDPVQEGTTVEAFVDDVKKADTTVDSEGRYGYNQKFEVWGTAGATVTFHVGGVEADEQATWGSGVVQELNLTIHEGAQPPVQYELAISSTTGGSVSTPGEGVFQYYAGAVVELLAEAVTGYGIVNWTANTTLTFADANAEETTFTMPDQAVTIIAHFGVAYQLAMAVDPVGGGDAIDVAAEGAYAAGATVRIRAVPNPGYAFGNWTADAPVTFGSVTAAETTFIMPTQAVTVSARFADMSPPPGVPTVTTLPATDISSYAGTIHMSYTVGYYTPVELRFACKRLTDPAWFYTTWVSRTTDGDYTEVLTGLVSQTQYQLKAQLKYGDTVIEGGISQFTTSAGSGTNLNDLLAYFGCFVATAAYGTPTAEQINVLREFRDLVLLKSTVGSQFVALYYRLSPPVAEFISGNEILRALVRELLVDPIVWLVEATGDTWQA